MNQTSFLLFSLNRLLVSILAAGILLSVSCEKEPEPLTTNSVIDGTAELFLPPQGEYTNIKVVARGPYDHRTYMVGSEHEYIFRELGNGTYYLEFSQDGYGTLRQYGLQLFGNDTVHAGSVHLFKKIGPYVMPLFIDAYSAERPDAQRLSICIETSHPSTDFDNGIPAMLFFDDQSNVSYKNYRISYPAWDYLYIPGFIDVPTIFVDTYQLPFASGTEVFVIGYVCNYDEYVYGYLDTYLGKVIYSTLDPDRRSNVISFIMP